MTIQDQRDFENEQAFDPPHCANCRRLEKRIEELEIEVMAYGSAPGYIELIRERDVVQAALRRLLSEMEKE